MLIKKLNDCPEFISGDKAILREVLNAHKGDFAFGYSLAHAIVRPGQKTLPHKLKTTEVYYILSGEGRMFVDNESELVTSGCAVYIPPKASQNIENTGKNDLVFLCIVDPAWRPEDEEVGDNG